MNKFIRKFNEASPAVKASMVLLVSNLVLKGLSFISGPVFTRIMTTEQYGLVSNFNSWRDIFYVFVTLNLASGVFNNGMLEFKNDRDRFQFSLIAITAILTGVFFVIFKVFQNQMASMMALPNSLVYVMILYYLTTPAFQFWSGRQRYEYKYKALACITIASAVASMILGIAIVLIVPSDYSAISKITVTEGINIIIGLFFILYTGYKAGFKVNPEYCKYALAFNIPLLPHYLSMYVLSSSDRIMITKMVNLSATAIYSVSYTVASVISILWQSIDASLSPWIYEKLDRNEEASVREVTGKVLLIFAAACLFCTLFAPEIMKILAPEEYASGIYVIPPVTAGVFFTAMYSVYMRVELFHKQSGFATIATSIAALANIFLNYVFIRLFGAVAAGYTTMVCYALLALLHYINIKVKHYDSAFDNKRFLVIAIIVVFATCFISFTYSLNWIRYALIAVGIVTVIIKRNNIISAVRMKR